MLPGAVINAEEGDYVLDLCAAPGGKRCNGGRHEGERPLIANDISSDRVKALVKNIELCGITNAIVTNESPDRLAKNLRIFRQDTCGCSLFRRRNVQKDEDAAKSWGKFKCDKCCAMQREILEVPM